MNIYFRLLCLLFGTIGIVIGGLMARRYWIYRTKQLEAEQRKKELEALRKERRRLVRDEELPENQLCVVCKANPIEVNFIRFFFF